MHDRPVYADASPLICLARINRLDVLGVLSAHIRVTTQMWKEIAGDRSWPGAAILLDAREAATLVVVNEGNPLDYPMLDPGEASVLSAARAAGGAVIVDERKARATLRSDPELRGSVGFVTTTALLVLGKRAGAVHQVRPILDDLRRESFRMSTALYEETLRAADEWPP